MQGRVRNMGVGLVTNHWGWTPCGVWRWVRFGWAKPFESWGIAGERFSLGGPRWVRRRGKVGPICFELPGYVEAAQSKCKHTHTFRYALDGARRIYGDPHGSRECRTPGLVLTGCYICGRVRVEDSRA